MSGRFHEINFITDVPTGSSSTGDINLPAGLYRLIFYGTQVAAGTAPTLKFSAYVDEAKSDAAVVPAGLSIDTGPIGNGVVPLDVTETALHGALAQWGSALGEGVPIFIPHGLKWDYTKNGGTAINLTLVAIPLTPTGR